MFCVPIVARTVFLDATLGNLTPWVHLYQGDIPLIDGLTLADLVECSVPGYAPAPAKGWSPAVLVDQIAWSWADPVLTVRGSGGLAEDVYGYYITDGENGPLLCLQRGPDAPYALALAGDKVVVYPALTFPQLPGQVCIAGASAGPHGILLGGGV